MNFDDEMLEQMILDGVVEFAGVDDSGDMLYSFAQNIEETHPEIFKRIMQMHVSDIHHLWEYGFLNMNMLEDNPLVTLNESAFDPEKVRTLPRELRLVLEQIKQASKIDRDD